MLEFDTMKLLSLIYFNETERAFSISVLGFLKPNRCITNY